MSLPIERLLKINHLKFNFVGFRDRKNSHKEEAAIKNNENMSKDIVLFQNKTV